MKKRSKRSKRKLAANHHQPRMPLRIPGDPHVVTWLLDESERMADLGNRWATAKTPNTLAAEMCLRVAWSHALSAAWLRCKLNGELCGNDSPPKSIQDVVKSDVLMGLHGRKHKKAH